MNAKELIALLWVGLILTNLIVFKIIDEYLLWLRLCELIIQQSWYIYSDFKSEQNSLSVWWYATDVLLHKQFLTYLH